MPDLVVDVGGITVTQQYMSAVTTLSDEFSGVTFDGILGLAYPPVSNLGQVRASAGSSVPSIPTLC